MSGYASFGSLFLLAILASSRSYAQQLITPNYVYHSCPNATTYSKNSKYSTNLKSLLNSLSSNSESSSSGFFNTTAGQSPDVVFGLFLCRGDVSPEVCRDCVVFATKDSLNRCPNVRNVLLYYDECMLRYSNRNILSTLNTNGGMILYNTQNDTSKRQYSIRFFVVSSLIEAANEASDNPRKFAVTKANFTASQSLYGLVQCTPDLTSEDCLQCLQLTISQLVTDQIGARYIVPSCSSRYEFFLFYNESATRTPRPTRRGEGGNSFVIIIAIVVPVTGAFLLFVAVFIFRAKKRRTVYETEPLAEDKDDITTAGSLQFHFKAIEAATDNFSQTNKLGQGGFGEVYKVLWGFHCNRLSASRN